MQNHTEAMRHYRADPGNREREKRINACRAAALVALAELHREEYEALCNAERASVGLPQLGERRGRPPKVTPVTSINRAKTRAADAKRRTAPKKAAEARRIVPKNRARSA